MEEERKEENELSEKDWREWHSFQRDLGNDLAGGNSRMADT